MGGYYLMRYFSVCSGIEAASVAWEPLGWKAVGFSEIEPFPSAVLKYRFPNTPNYGDATKHHEWPIEQGSVDLLVFGSPCQSFSVAGLRKGLADPRGNLALVILGFADRIKPKWIIWENVPGVLSSNGGKDFGSFLGALGELGYGFAYRVLDAVHFGVPQRRRRVFVVACLGAGGWESAAKVLFEPESLCRDIAKGRKKGQGVAADAQSGAGTGGAIAFRTTQAVVNNEPTVITFQPGNLRREAGADPSTTATTTLKASAGDQMPHIVYCAEVTGTLTVGHHSCAGHQHRMGDNSFLIGDQMPQVATPMAVRRLTPTECMRLQGFPDDHARIPWKKKPADQCPDGPQYKAAGNSMAVPVMRWIGSRIQMVEDLTR